MIILGIVFLLVAYLLPYVIAVPPGILHVLTVLGWIGIVVGMCPAAVRAVQWPDGRRAKVLVLIAM